MLDVNRQIKALPDVNYLVVGLGLSGYSVARFLLAHGYRCRVQDTRELPPFLGELRKHHGDVDFNPRPLDDALIAWADALVVSPGLPILAPDIQRAVRRGKGILGDVELFARLADAPVIAITGSNGKSTVTTLVGEMIRRADRSVAVGGNLGTPALDLLADSPEFYVLELSSYQLETTHSLRSRVAALLNLCEDHLDRYASYRDYIDAKLRIYRNAEICVSNHDDLLTHHDSHDIRFSLEPAADAEFRLRQDDATWLAHRDEGWLRTDELKLSGRHNWANGLAAMAIAHALGIGRDAIVEALRDFGGIPHRSQFVAEVDGVEFVNDSKATNVGAAQASIDGRDRPVILIAGGQAKGADMTVMADTLRRKVKRVLLFGEDAPRLEAAWRDATGVERVRDMREAVTRAYEIAERGDCVLLAPACASFDMYPKFEARGDDFMARVRELEHG